MAKTIKIPLPSGQEGLKLPRGDKSDSADKNNPLFSFEFLSSDYCLSLCTKAQKVQFVDRIRVLGSQTWGEIKLKHRNSGGFELIPKNEIRSSIPKIITQDVDKIHVFHFGDHIPLAGTRQKEVFYIIWIDRDFTLYKH